MARRQLDHFKATEKYTSIPYTHLHTYIYMYNIHLDKKNVYKLGQTKIKQAFFKKNLIPDLTGG